MTQQRPRRVPAGVGRADLDQLSRLRRLRAAAAGPGLRRARDAEHPRGLRAEARTSTWRALGPSDPMYWHLMVEAKKLAYSDLLAKQRRSEVRERAGRRAAVEGATRRRCAGRSIRTSPASPAVAGGTDGGTIYLTTADRWGNMVSLVHSVFSVYGSRATVPPYGFVLHNRGSAFSLDPEEPEPRRAAQAAVPHDHRRLRDEGRPAADDVRQHGRQRAARNARAAHGQPDRSRHERADDDRRGALHAQPELERAVARDGAVQPGRRGAEGARATTCARSTAARSAAIRAFCSRAIRRCRSRRSTSAASGSICRSTASIAADRITARTARRSAGRAQARFGHEGTKGTKLRINWSFGRASTAARPPAPDAAASSAFN